MPTGQLFEATFNVQPHSVACMRQGSVCAPSNKFLYSTFNGGGGGLGLGPLVRLSFPMLQQNLQKERKICDRKTFRKKKKNQKNTHTYKHTHNTHTYTSEISIATVLPTYVQQ